MTTHILVCTKQVLDPDGVNSYALWGRLEVDSTGRGFDAGGAIPQIINAYDEQAVEAALRLRDAGVDCTITVAVVGDEDAASILRRCIAMGADRAIHVVADEGEDGRFPRRTDPRGARERTGQRRPRALRPAGFGL